MATIFLQNWQNDRSMIATDQQLYRLLKPEQVDIAMKLVKQRHWHVLIHFCTTRHKILVVTTTTALSNLTTGCITAEYL